MSMFEMAAELLTGGRPWPADVLAAVELILDEHDHAVGCPGCRGGGDDQITDACRALAATPYRGTADEADLGAALVELATEIQRGKPCAAEH